MPPENPDQNIEFQNVGLFSYERFPVKDGQRHGATMDRPHRHNDLEFVYLASGSLSYIFGSQFLNLKPKTLILFWGGFSHKVSKISAGSHLLGLHLPLSWYLDWNLPDDLTQQLLHGKILSETDPKKGPADFQLLKRLVADFNHDVVEDRRAAILELESRVWRFASSHRQAKQPAAGSENLNKTVLSEVSSKKVEKMALFISDNYTRPIHIEDIAEAVDLHPNYAMKLFHKSFGTTLADYLIQHRIAHAQRQLTITDAKVLNIALDCGFGSLSRFNANFKRLCNVSPREYRQSLRNRSR